MKLSYRPTGYALKPFERFTEQSYATLFSAWASIIVVMAAGYFVLSTYVPMHGVSGMADMDPLRRLGNSLYFSVMTVTTVGYGDHVPLGFSKVLASFQGVFGFFVFAVFISKLVSRKSERLTAETHSLMFENKFHLTREGFFTIRKDFDAIIRDAEENEPIGEDDWDKLAIAYWEGQRLLESIPVFYGDGGTPSIIDTKRERLLIETVHRTYERLLRMLQSLDKRNIDWHTHERHESELSEFIVTSGDTLRQWRRTSRDDNAEWFDRLGEAVATLRKRIR